MSGYFSRLAHHTGLSFEPGTTGGTSSLAPEPNVAVQGPRGAPPDALHVEEIAFTAAPPPDTAKGNAERLRTVSDRDRAWAGTTEVPIPEQTESKDDDHLHSDEATAKRSMDASPRISWEESRILSTDSAFSTMNLREHSAVEDFPASEPQVTRPDGPSGAERRSLSQESIAIPDDSIEIVEIHSAARDQQAQLRQPSPPEANDAGEPGATGDREQMDAIRDEHVEPETIVHNYLKEVRAWVSEPPDFDQRELEWQHTQSLPATHGAGRFLASHTDVVALEPEVQSAAPRPTRSESLDVQDLNLSIGTISIVIEEPKQIAPAVLQAPARADSSRERLASEPTRLSRYYLGRW